MIKLKTPAAVVVVLAGAMAIGAATPSVADDDDKAAASSAMLGASAANASASAAYAAGPRAFVPSLSGDIGNDVYVNGMYVGSDPDPRIRASIRAEERGNSSNNGGEGSTE